MNQAIIGQNIRKFRDKLGMSQETVAEYLGISRVMISYYESGEKNIPLPHLHQIADLFGIDLLDLLEENSENVQLNLAFAFRAGDLSKPDLVSIADFKRIVKSFLKMQKLSGQ